MFDPWARIVETVDSPDDVWVQAVERYVALQSGDPSKTKERIEAEIQRLRPVATPEAQAIAADLEYHLLRGNRAGTWGSFSMPTLTAASVPGQKGAQFNCVAGTPPSLMLVAAPSSNPPRIIIDGVAYPVMAAELTPVERAMIAPPRKLGDDTQKEEPRSLYRLADSASLGALRAAVKNVSVEVDAKPIISGLPLDALLRWASQCEKLQKLPAPTEDELRRPSM